MMMTMMAMRMMMLTMTVVLIMIMIVMMVTINVKGRRMVTRVGLRRSIKTRQHTTQRDIYFLNTKRAEIHATTRRR